MLKRDRSHIAVLKNGKYYPLCNQKGERIFLNSCLLPLCRKCAAAVRARRGRLA